MLTAVERVMILRGADLLRDVGPRHLLELAEVAREVEFVAGEIVFREDDNADALYMVVEGRVRLSTGGRALAEVGPGEAFGTWALVDESARGQQAECIEDGMALALHRDAFYDVAAGNLDLLKEFVRALSRRLRALVSERPEVASVEGEGIEKPEAMQVPGDAGPGTATEDATPATPGAALAAAALGKVQPGVPPAPAGSSSGIPTTGAERANEQPNPLPKPS